jgi:hypothetical protein
MKSFSAITLFSFLPLLSFSQQRSEIIKINSKQENAYLKGYINDAFQDGKVILKEGGYAKAKLNFNCLTNEMLFISPKGDTLKLLHPEATSMVIIQTDTFNFGKNTFLQRITHYNSPVNLFQKITLKHIDDEKKAAYGYSAVTGDASNNTFTQNGITTYIDADRNMVFKKNYEVFISNNTGDFLNVKQGTLNKMFPQFKNQIKAFIDDNNINFDKEDDIIQIVDYIQKLQLPKGDH